MDEKINYKRLFCDICQGFSLINCKLGNLYFKHVSINDQVHIDELRESFIEEAQSRGLPTVKDALLSLKDEGYWTDKEELSISQEEMFLQN